jgi:eukaryotic-like serine/threonine-protein kinase
VLTPGTVLQNRYRIVRQLGQGGMGAVYEAVDQRLDSTVALKETLFMEEKLRKQFEREARLLARLHHPALPRVSDHFAEGDGEFLVMQYIAGDDLAEMIAQRRAFPVEQVLSWADQLLDALDYLHTQEPQIIHRDIKPQNLKLTARGQIVLLDFGLAKGQVGDLSRATTAASIFGYTPNYAPLEQVQGLGTDSRSDLYSLAATIYHLLTGVKPPDALTRAAAIVNGQPDPLQPANQVNSAVGANVAAMLQRAMAQNREARYAAAAEMRRALHEGGETVVMPSKSEAATVLFTSSSAPTVSTGGPTMQPTTPQTGETTVVKAPQPSAKRSARAWAIGAAALVLLGGGFGAFYAYHHRGNSAAPASPLAPTGVVNTPQPQASASQAANTPSEPAIAKKDKAKAESEKPTPKKEEVAKKNEKSEKQKSDNEKSRTGNDASANSRARAGDAHTNDKRTAQTERSESDQQERRNQRGPGVRQRTLPDGTKVMITPNGTRIVTYPDGSTRVFPPGRKMQRP